MEHEILTNVSLKPEQKKNIFSDVSENDVIFTMVSDLNVQGLYAENVFAITADSIYSADENGQRSVYKFCDIASCFAKRCYGSAQMCIELKDGTDIVVARFSYNKFSVFDAAASFISAASEGQKTDELIFRVEDAFTKAKSICPKCNRRLLHAGGECVYCDKKSSLFGKIVKYIKPYTKKLVFCIILSVIITVVALIPPYFTGYLVDVVFPLGDKKLLSIIVFVLLGSYILQFGLGIIRNYILRVCGDKMVKDLRTDIFEKAQRLPMSFYDKTSTGSVINRINSDTATINNFLLRVSQDVVVQACMLVGIIVIMLIMNWKLALLSLCPVPLVVIGSRIFGVKIRPYYNYIWRRTAALMSMLANSLPGIRVIKTFTNEENTSKEFERKNEDWLDTDIRSARITIAFPTIVSFLFTCGSLLIWSVGGFAVIDTPDAVSAGLLVSFISYASMFYGPVGFFANLNDSYQGTLASTERVTDILDAEPEHNDGEGKLLENVQGKIEFRHVDFSFDKVKKTLNDVSFVINPGDVVGIVGTTGAGKSTIMNLMMRFYDTYEGEILLDGCDIRQIDLQSYRSVIGYVQQEPMMFRDTIFNNIAYGCENADIETVMNAASVANAHEFIARLPDGYDTVLGEHGVGVSGGERQRISIARAVFRDPKILFFDEATASVDSETESQIQEAIDRLVRNRTTIMIAHRLSTLRKANKIIVVGDGKIIEMGEPDELIARKGKYAKLIEIQTMSDHIRKTKEEEHFD